MTKYSVTIGLDKETLAALNNGFQLQVYKGVKTPNPENALSTVWLHVDKFSKTVTLSWIEEFGGYFSNSKVQNGVVVDIGNQEPMNPGDVVTLSDTGSTSVSTIGGVKGSFAFKSDQKTQWSSGLMSKIADESNPEGVFSPICIFPQYGAVGNIMLPYEKILLLFTQDQVDTGAVVKEAISKSVSIIMSTKEPAVSVKFGINTGWDTEGNPQVKENPENFALAPELIVPMAS